MTKTEKLVLAVIEGKEKFSRLYYYNNPDKYNRKKSVDNAIDKLKEKGIIEKGNDNILRRIT